MSCNIYAVSLLVVSTLLSAQENLPSPDLSSEVAFMGAVIDTTPQWQWQIWPDTQEWAKDWNADIKDGITSNGTTTFDYKDSKGFRRKNYLQGYMRSPAEKGGALLKPVISINTVDGLQQLSYNAEKQPITLLAIGHASDGSITKGTLSLVVESALAVFFKRKTEPKKYFILLNNTNGGTIPVVARGILMSNLAHYREIYSDKGEQTHLWQDRAYDVSRVLSGADETDAYDISAGYSSSLSDVKTHWTTVPSKWTAQLNIQVQMQ